MPKINGVLNIINSKADKTGNCYWCFTYCDTKTEHCVRGTVSGGESNIYGILRHMNEPDDWDRSIIVNRQEMSIGEFNHFTEGMSHAGCEPSKLAEFIKAKLQEIKNEN